MIPDYQFIMLPLLKVLSDGKEHTVEDVENSLANYFKLTEDEKDLTFKGNKQKIFYGRISWAKSYLKAARLVESERRGRVGYWKITDRGLEVLSKNPENINNKYLIDNFQEFRDWYQNSKFSSEEMSDTLVLDNVSNKSPEELVQENVELLNSLTKDELKEIILNLSPTAFEKLVVDVLVKMGYGGSYEEASQHLGRSNDEGVDGVIKQDVLGLDNIYIQAKRWNSAIVGRKELQSFVGVLHGKGSKKGVFITTSKFTEEAVKYAGNLSDFKLILIDGDKLVDYMMKYRIGVRTHIPIEIFKVDLDYFEGY
ncbi:MAG: restriction endonuclease [Candidatus Hydrogenedens sp.]|nr:restriction endonuclease [Candidatus Hydrogenedens sp.]